MTHWLHGVFFHSWHFLYTQIQLTTWFGNIVAGVVTFLAVGMFWPPTRKRIERFVGRYFSALHTKLDGHHAERMDQAEKHHREAVALAKKHHEIHMSAISPRPASPTPVKAPSTVKKATPRSPRSTK